jgi:malonyl-CoA O-methyltransferase
VAVSKLKITDNFARHSLSYSQNAMAQSWAATKLLGMFFAQPSLGSVLEIGCGTGFASIPIIAGRGKSEVLITDAAPVMVEACKSKTVAQFGNIPDGVSFRKLDADLLDFESKFDSIFSSFAMQWCADFKLALARAVKALKPRGRVFVAVPTDKSFQEWKQACINACVPCTVNPLPSMRHITELGEQLGFDCHAVEEELHLEYASSLDFFRSLKLTGSSTALHSRQLTSTQMRKLCAVWDSFKPGCVSVTYSVGFAIINKRT